MELLLELYEINRSTSVFNPNKDKNKRDSKLEIFFEAIKKGEIDTDDKAAALLYRSDPSNPNYQRLKSRLVNRLIDGIIVSNTSTDDFSSYQKSNINCHRNWSVIKLLYTKNARTTAIRMAERTIVFAKKYEFTDLQYLISRELRNHYSQIDYNKYKHNKYNQEFEEAFRTYQAEIEVEGYYNEALFLSLNSRGAVKPEVLQKLTEYIVRIRELLEENSSYRLLFISFMTFSMRHQYAYDFKSMLAVCTEASEIFKSRSVSTPIAIFNFDLRRMICYMQMEQYESSDPIAQAYLTKMQTGTYNWYYILFYYYTSLMHREKYEKAREVLNEGLYHKNFKSIAPNLRQIYKVNEGYIEFLVSIDVIPQIEQRRRGKDVFRLYKFLNEIPIFARDKRGVNISILIIHVLFLLQQKKYSALIDRVDALRQYTHRYLRKDDTFRSNCFINMLLCIPKAEFNRIRTERYAKQFREKLNEKSLYLAEQGIEVEIIPYEKLWALTLSLLD